MMSHSRLSSTMLKMLCPGSNSFASVWKTGIMLGDVWMNAIMSGASLNDAEEIRRTNLSALEGHLDSVRGRGGRAHPAQRRAARQLADHFHRFDSPRGGDLARSISTGDEDTAQSRRG